MSTYTFRPMCPKCGEELFPPDAAFCTQCGAKVTRDVSVYEIAFDDSDSGEETISVEQERTVSSEEDYPRPVERSSATVPAEGDTPVPAPPVPAQERKSEFQEEPGTEQPEQQQASSPQPEPTGDDESAKETDAAGAHGVSSFGMPQPYYIPVVQPASGPGYAKAKDHSGRKLNRKMTAEIVALAVVGVAIITVAGFLVWKRVIAPSREYNRACSLLEEGEYDDAIDIFESLGDYKDSSDRITESRYEKACSNLEDEEYLTAEELFRELGDYRNSEEMAAESRYRYGISLLDTEHYEEAISIFEALDGYSESEDYLNESKYQYCRANRYCFDENTYEYLCYLKSISYQQSDSLYHEIFDVRAEEAFANTAQNDNSTLVYSVSKYCTFFHIGFNVYGGTPGEEFTLYRIVTYPDGTRANGSNDSWGNVENGTTCSLTWEKGIYPLYPEFCATGTMYVDIYNKKNGKRILRMTVYVTE